MTPSRDDGSGDDAASMQSVHDAATRAPARPARAAGRSGCARAQGDQNVSNHRVEAGWQRFLDRLKQLWGKLLGGSGATAPTALLLAP
jgi:hypothetical protein